MVSHQKLNYFLNSDFINYSVHNFSILSLIFLLCYWRIVNNFPEDGLKLVITRYKMDFF